MSIDWKPEAIEAALSTYHGTYREPQFGKFMRAALDAAVRAQGDLVVPYDTFHATMAGVRADTLEEAASICPCRGNEIRALMEKKG